MTFSGIEACHPTEDLELETVLAFPFSSKGFIRGRQPHAATAMRARRSTGITIGLVRAEA